MYKLKIALYKLIIIIISINRIRTSNGTLPPILTVAVLFERVNVYKIDYKDCEKAYIDQTSRVLKKETDRKNTRAIFLGEANSLLAQHQTQIQHEFDVYNAQIIDKCQQWSSRLFLEARHSVQNRNSINEHIHVPNVYNVS